MTRHSPRLCTGLLIDPIARAIGPVQVDPDNAEEINALLGCDIVEVVQLDDKTMLFVDENGLIRDTIQPFFQFDGLQPMAGRGVIFDCDSDGRIVSTTMSLPDLWGRLSFPDIEFQEFRQTEEILADPILGRVPAISIEAIFKPKQEKQ